MSVLIYTPAPSTRLEYIAGFIFRKILGIDFRFCHRRDAFLRAGQPRINYSNESFDLPCLSIPVHSFLKTEAISNWEPEVFSCGSLPAFFGVDQPGNDLPFDLFSLAFYLLSRYEEYLDFTPDTHGRFPASRSLAFRAGFLDLPLIDLWALELRDRLQERFPAIRFDPPAYRFRPTVDIDMAWSFRHKGWWRSLGAGLQDGFRGDFRRLVRRLRVLAGRESDPFDTFDELRDLHRRFRLDPVYFWLLGSYGPYDKNSDPDNPAFQQLIRRVSQNVAAGLHPSYGSNTHAGALETEKHRLEQITGREISISRQHFLLLRFPETYRALLAAGIREDYTMGYAAATGFRAGTTHPFQWYDLQKEAVTSLIVHPFQVMDVSLQQYLGCSPEESMDIVNPLIESTRKAGGQFVSIWHNSSLSEEGEWKGWRKVYKTLLERAAAAG